MDSTPLPDRDSRPYWQALADGRFLLQQCGACSHWSWPPRPICMNCQSDDLSWTEPSGTGEVHSWVVCHRAYSSLPENLPYTIAMVRLDEGADLLVPGRLLDAEGIHQGMRVRVAPQPLSAEVGDLCWRAA
jgi:uncharacterized OB-fold protein